VTIWDVFPGVAGFTVGIEVLINPDVIEVDGVPIGDVSVTIQTGAQVELPGGKGLALPGHAFSQACEMPTVKGGAGEPV
jgi:hypothetical protein